MARALATIRKVKTLTPIINADFIELCHIDGWQCIVKKDEAKIGELVVYFEIDSFLPLEERYEFLRKSSFKNSLHLGTGFRIKTMKMKSVLSQGLVLPLKEFPELDKVKEGEDVTEVLNVRLYEKYFPSVNRSSSPNKSRAFPYFIRKTDQNRLQNLLDYFEQYKEAVFEITEKLDGCSMTIYAKKDNSKLRTFLQKFFKIQNKIKVGVCSRNVEIGIGKSMSFSFFDGEDVYSKFCEEIKMFSLIKELRKILDFDFAIQGELCGPKIQGNYYELLDLQYFIFDIWDITNQKYINSNERFAIYRDLERIIYLSNNDAKKISHVPLISYMNFFHKYTNIEDALKFAEGKTVLINKKDREGIVLKQINCENPISFKIINNTYLLKEKE